MIEKLSGGPDHYWLYVHNYLDEQMDVPNSIGRVFAVFMADVMILVLPYWIVWLFMRTWILFLAETD